MKTEKENEEKETGLHAKPVSLKGQIVAAVWIAAWCTFHFVTNIKSVRVTDFILSGLAIAGCFTPVYFNMLMDKIKDIRWG